MELDLVIVYQVKIHIWDLELISIELLENMELKTLGRRYLEFVKLEKMQKI
jgi:hypothetical protein